jgi:hypothetical protein
MRHKLTPNGSGAYFIRRSIVPSLDFDAADITPILCFNPDVLPLFISIKRNPDFVVGIERELGLFGLVCPKASEANAASYDELESGSLRIVCGAVDPQTH